MDVGLVVSERMSFEIAVLANGSSESLDLCNLTPLDAGAFASAWRAGGDGQYAVKSFHDAGEGVARAEYDLLVRLNGAGCPHVPRAYCLGTLVDVKGARHHAIVEQYVEGETLARVLGDGLLTGNKRVRTLGERQAALVALEVARALGAIAGCGIAHRDLSPNNVMLTTECIKAELRGGAGVYLVDFGQSTLTERLTVTPVPRLATIPYGAPEMFGGQHYEDRNKPWCDTWSLGALICAMVAGEYWPEGVRQLRSPDHVLTREDLELVASAKRTPIDLVARMREAGVTPGPVGRRLADVVRLCTSYDPADRPSMRDVIGDLEDLVRGPFDIMPSPITPTVEFKRPAEQSAANRASLVNARNKLIEALSLQGIGVTDGNATKASASFNPLKVYKDVFLVTSIPVVGNECLAVTEASLNPSLYPSLETPHKILRHIHLERVAQDHPFYKLDDRLKQLLGNDVGQFDIALLCEWCIREMEFSTPRLSTGKLSDVDSWLNEIERNEFGIPDDDDVFSDRGRFLYHDRVLQVMDTFMVGDSYYVASYDPSEGLIPNLKLFQVGKDCSLFKMDSASSDYRSILPFYAVLHKQIEYFPPMVRSYVLSKVPNFLLNSGIVSSDREKDALYKLCYANRTLYRYRTIRGVVERKGILFNRKAEVELTPYDSFFEHPLHTDNGDMCALDIVDIESPRLREEKIRLSYVLACPIEKSTKCPTFDPYVYSIEGKEISGKPTSNPLTVREITTSYDLPPYFRNRFIVRSSLYSMNRSFIQSVFGLGVQPAL